ncbi:2-amino-4-oxopentanoate thiolase subunit OrtB [Anaerovoracaceae bacterium 41-7]|jgi:cysteine synthase|uniref:PLP-dependent lyase/thiolase n=1 Tax=Anaerotruncus colihominis TaxID=169435 RepID=A0A845QIZ1_9FIRM|nr:MULTISPECIES: 2-amino-4-oxopentanoate thiolase subunit OrtB [Clostridia]MCI9476370.1 PLP-dependent lyase/thiolase [Emergencia sp.]MCI9640079.1 PLP-dependent lyase/thiolase [Emergencia sp.]NBH60657.1 PLP-dependent lyase/thiolase [Anaerotruncus colihominis]NCE99333.1 pyridoxal-phosphate dependent enzyme [Emergencia sp. 1XD21-10]NCF01311.1 pyridoxal-phosphate dependent enzyme [Anaerotruncus sp. 80]
MTLAKDYDSVMGRSNEIQRKALGLDYAEFESGSVAFDYEALMKSTGYTLEEVAKIQAKTAVGNTPLIELRNLTALARKYAKPGYGARIFAKDEAANASGSFKARRAACAVAHAKKLGYKGVIAATSGNYGAAVASQAAMQGMECIIVQECYDSKGVGQPEIVEKARKCEAYGAEVIQLTVGPELFYTFLSVLEDTGYFNASLYSPFGIAGVETLGYEIAMQCRELVGKDPDMVVCTNAGGGMMTGTARGLLKAGAVDTEMVSASIDLTGLHMASDEQFNKKSCTTGHTGFGVPYATDPDHSDVPRSAARPLRYMDRYVTVTQGEVMYMTEALANLEGIERGPAGNTALAAAFSLAQELPEDAVLVISETEYTGAGKHIQPQLDFARENGIEIKFGNPQEEDKPGVNIILPKDPSFVKHKEADITHFRKSLIKKAVKKAGVEKLTDEDIQFLVAETNTDTDFVMATLAELGY